MKKTDFRNIITDQDQMSEAFIVNAILAFSGGFQDAYTDITRDGVFANAQTGNIVLMSTSFLQGKWLTGVRYLGPILAFILGVLIADTVDKKWHKTSVIHWRQIVVALEIIILFAVGFMPPAWNIAANILVSFSCAIQVQAFRTVGGGIVYASTMCVGNLRSGTAALSEYIHTKQKENLHRALYYFGIILVFALGAGIGGIASMHFSQHIIWVCCVLLLAASLLMDFDRKGIQKTHEKKK